MSRTVVSVHLLDSGLAIHLYEPRNIPDSEQLIAFSYCPSDPVPSAFEAGEDQVHEIGRYMVDALYEHPAVKQAIMQQLSAGSDEVQPLLLRIPIEADGLPWETMFANKSFLALDPRWPIARLSPYEPEVPQKDFQPPLRVLAVLAADEHATEKSDASEWAALLAALETAAFRVSVKALVASDALLTEINATKSNVVDAHAAFVPTGRALVGEISSFNPHILHFFCHGRMASGRSSLQLSTRLSVNGAGSPLTMEAADIQSARTSDLWLVALNCCGSARSDHGVGSFAFTLADQGVPAVIGMRQEVNVRDANVFTASFYKTLMLELWRPVKQPGQSVEIDWPAMLYEPRMSIAEANAGAEGLRAAAESCRTWALPALYLASRSHRLIGRPPAADTQPIGPIASKVPTSVLKASSTLGLRKDVAPALTDEDRAYAEVKLDFLRDLESRELGTPSAALEKYREEIEALELQLYGDEGATSNAGPEPPQ
jgi:CHAT domain